MPRMPLSGVRISCDTIARKRDLARFAASAASRASASARPVSVRSVTSRPTLCTSPLPLASMNTTASRQASQRGPSAVSIFWSCMRVPSGITLISPCSSTGSAVAVPRNASRGCPGERAERIVGVGDAALAVAADDQIALRFEQAAARASASFSSQVKSASSSQRNLAARSSSAQPAVARHHHQHDAAHHGEQAGDADRERRWVVDRLVDGIEVREQHRQRPPTRRAR